MTSINKGFASYFLILVLFLVSIHWYYLDRMWDAVLTVFCILLLFLFGNKQYSNILKASVWGIAIFYLYKLFRFPGLGVLIEPLVLIVVLMMPEDKKKAALRFLTVSFSIITLCSIIAWILYLFGIVDIHQSFEYRGYNLGLHPLFLVNMNLGMGIIPRFQGLLLEPGHLGMICSLLLYANNYNRKDFFSIILFLGVILTLSLAAYVLLIIGFLLFYAANQSLKVTFLLFCVIIVGSIYSLFQSTDSMLYHMLIDKVVDSENGIMNANRYGLDFLQYYSRQMSDPFVALFGMGDAFNIERFAGNSGYRIGVISMGWIGVLLLFYAYYCIARPYHSKKGYFFLLLYVISYIQRPYADWLAEWFIFILAMPGLAQSSCANKSIFNNEKVLLSNR